MFRYWAADCESEVCVGNWDTPLCFALSSGSCSSNLSARVFGAAPSVTWQDRRQLLPLSQPFTRGTEAMEWASTASLWIEVIRGLNRSDTLLRGQGVLILTHTSKHCFFFFFNTHTWPRAYMQLCTQPECAKETRLKENYSFILFEIHQSRLTSILVLGVIDNNLN